MANTIREQIILACLSRLSEIKTTKGYNTNLGDNVQRVNKNIDPDDLPAIILYPQIEEITELYGNYIAVMPLKIEGVLLYETSNPSIKIEQMLGDIVEVMTCTKYSFAFTSGGTYTPLPGHTITGHTSGATALIESVTLSSGTWAGGDAAGTFLTRRKVGTFTAETLDIGANVNVANITGTATATLPIVGVTGGLAESINYVSGGSNEYPQNDEVACGCTCDFEIKYALKKGNPYAQPS